MHLLGSSKMDFDTNKRTLFLASIALVLAFLFILKNHNSHHDKVDEEATVKVKKNSKDIEILYVKDDANSKDNSKISSEKEASKQRENREVMPDDEEEIAQYIEQHSLKNITTTKEQLADENYEIPRFSVYANIDKSEALKLKDKTLPPSTPIIVKGAFNSGVPYAVAIDANIYSKAKDIVISNNEPDGTIEEIVNIKNTKVEDDEREVISPPTIGSNTK